MSVQPLTTFNQEQLFNLGSRPQEGSHRLDARISGLSIVQELSGRLNVTTADGDRITLVADRDDRYDAGAVQSVVQTPHGSGTVSAGFAQGARANHVGIAVSGDLNEAEVTDLEKLFEKVSSIFRGFFQGRDDDAQAQTLHLAEGFHGLEHLSSLDLSVEIVRSVTVVSASRETPGGAPGTVAAIPQPSNGTTAPTPSSDSPDGTHLTVPVKDAQLASLIQQVLDVLKEAKVDLDKVRKHLPDFFDKLHEDLAKELRGEQEPKADPQDHSLPQVSAETNSATTSSSLLVTYRTVTETSLLLSIQS